MQGLSKEEMLAKAPAIFATSPSPEVGRNYGFVPTFKIMATLQNEGYYPVKVQQRGKGEFAKHVIRFRHADYFKITEEFRKKIGSVFPECVIANAHDTTSSFNMMMGLFRLVCSNGMIVADGPTEKIKFRHVSVQEEVIPAVETMTESIPSIMEEVAEMRGIKVSESLMLEYAKEALPLRFNFDVEPEKLLVSHRSEDENKDLWSVFSRVQENLTKGGYEVTRNRPVTAREVTNLDDDLRINRGLWRLNREFISRIQ